jgi:hypothetical protein
MDDDSKQLEHFERMGEAAVRMDIDNDCFPHSIRALAINWLAQRDQESERRREASQAEQIDIARSAKDAAWEAARAAKKANTIATIAVVMAIIRPSLGFIRTTRTPRIRLLARFRPTLADFHFLMRLGRRVECAEQRLVAAARDFRVIQFRVFNACHRRLILTLPLGYVSIAEQSAIQLIASNSARNISFRIA